MLTSIITVMKFSVRRVNVIGRRGTRGYYSGTGEGKEKEEEGEGGGGGGGGGG